MSTARTTLHQNPNFICEIATIDDIPRLSEIWYKAFSKSFPQRLFPKTAAVQLWWDNANRSDFLHNPSIKYIIVRDIAAEAGKGKIVGYIKWVVPVKGVDFIPHPRFPPWPAEADKILCDQYFGALERERWKHIKKNRDYWIDMFCTLPDYQGMGAGTMMLNWGCILADNEGVQIYVNATDKGRSTYERMGLEAKNRFQITEDIVGISCVREPQSGGAILEPLSDIH